MEPTPSRPSPARSCRPSKTGRMFDQMWARWAEIGGLVLELIN
ncbi:hypothetical protein ACWGAN_14010 [Streptomyces sp. NPDC054945]